MTYVLNKIVGWMLSPLGIASLLLVLAVAAAYWGCVRRLTVGLLAVAFGWLWFWGMPMTMRWIGVPLESPYFVDGRIPDGAAYAVGDAIVILGGGMASASEIGNFGEMSDGADRVWRGARLWKAGKAPRLIATGDGCRASTAELLADLAVPTQAVTFLESARNTEEEVRQIAAAGVTNVLLVTSAWHMNRARLLFAKFAPALKVRPAPADFENSVSAACMRGLSDYLPQADALKRNSAAFREYVGYWGYRLFR